MVSRFTSTESGSPHNRSIDTSRGGGTPGTDPAIRKQLDPRWYQIAVLGTLLCYGLFVLRFDLSYTQVAAILSTVLVTQLCCTLWLAGGRSGAKQGPRWILRFEPRSALISGLSLCLLLRSGSLGLIVAVSVLTILSKFVIRYRGKHLFNPTNFGIAAAVALTGNAWVSPGQWGSEAIVASMIFLAGLTVVAAAARSDVTWSFIAAYGGLLLVRALRLGDPLEIPLHQISSGAFVIFAFFMISDPRSTPDSRAGRVLFAVLVASLAYIFRFWYFSPNGLIYSLVLVSPLTPFIDWILPGERYRWDAPHGGGRQAGENEQGALLWKPLPA